MSYTISSNQLKTYSELQLASLYADSEKKRNQARNLMLLIAESVFTDALNARRFGEKL